MTRFRTKRLVASALLAVLAFTLSGCWNPFAPDEGDPQPVPPADYHDRLTPQDVLHNLQTAYVWKNAVQYLDCLSEGFAFYPSDADVQDPNQNIPPVWWKPDERTMHENMFASSSDVESISLTLTITSIIFYENDPDIDSDNEYDVLVDVDLRVNVVGDLTYLATAPSQYIMRIDIDQPGPDNEDTWWEIVEWYDLGDPGRGDSEDEPGVVRVSFAELKQLFME